MTDLIKTVRGLDQSGPGENGEILGHLWTCLAASADRNFHAAEENILRWLLKSMKGTTPAAETLRRYPLTWRLLGCVFQKIPLFPLAKALADRRFLAVLQQTLKEVAAASPETSPSQSTKRRRFPSANFSLEDLKSIQGRIQSSQAIIEALGRLIGLIDESTLPSARDKIGAEHVKSLFGAAGTGAATIEAPLLSMCNTLLESGHAEDVEDCENWIATISSTWNQHLQGNNDSLEVAAHLFTPAAILLANLENLIPHELPIPEGLRTRWSADLQKFMHKTLILPARSAFVNQKKDEAIVIALQVADGRIEAAAPALYLFASTATGPVAQNSARKGSAEWMKRVFQVAMESLKGRPRTDYVAVMKKILEQARQRSMAVRVEDLRSVCREYAIDQEAHGTDWSLVANLAQCDPDMFQGGEEGSKLLKEVCARTLDDHIPDDQSSAVSQVVRAVIQGFRTARDFPSFLKLWYQQLSEIEQRKLKLSPWLSVGREGDTTISSKTWIEQELSTKQLVDILDWVEAQETRPKALCVWLNGVSEGIESDEFKDAMGEKLFGLAQRISKSKSDITALKWRIMAKAFAWAPLSSRDEIWGQIKDPLHKILKKSPVISAETFEAFKCASRMCVSASPDGAQSADATKLVSKFTTRLAGEVASAGVADDRHLPLCLESETESEFTEESGLQQYLAWYLRGSSRLGRLYFQKEGQIPLPVQGAVSDEKATPRGLEAAWHCLLGNDYSINDAKLAENIVDRAVTALIESKRNKHWPDEQGQMWLRLISSLPFDTVTRQQRERIMAVLMDAFRSGKSPNKTTSRGWNLALSLGAKLMARSTFYEGMSFQHLVDAAQMVSQAFADSAGESKSQEELIRRYSRLASATIRQMAENIDERSLSYFAEASAFVSRCQSVLEGDRGQELPPLHLTLLKALHRELSQSPSCQGHLQLASLPSDAKAALGQGVGCFFREWVNEKKLFSKPNAAADSRLLALTYASQPLEDLPGLQDRLKASSLRKLEKRSLEAMQTGDMRGWRMQTFLQRYLSTELEVPRPATFHSLEVSRSDSRETLVREYVESIVKTMAASTMMQYLEALIAEYHGGCDTDGQLLAIAHVVDQLIETTDPQGKEEDFDLSTAFSEMTRALAAAKTTANSVHICRILSSILERKPHNVSQWNVEYLLSTVAILSAQQSRLDSGAPYIMLCKLVEVIIRKHRLRLEGHFHILLSTMQPLLRNLIQDQRKSHTGDGGIPQELKASAYGRLITLVCEPTAGAVSRSRHHSALDSAIDAAKRTAGRHMYLILMQYVKLQLEVGVPRPVREALEPAMNSIFDITTLDGRKILNYAVDASGRAILREMSKRYTRFGKWSGV